MINFITFLFSYFIPFFFFHNLPFPFMPLRLEFVGSFWRLDINIPVLLHSDILPDAPLLGAATRPTASSRRAATRG